jgi:hypothetical protein
VSFHQATARGSSLLPWPVRSGSGRTRRHDRIDKPMPHRAKSLTNRNPLRVFPGAVRSLPPCTGHTPSYLYGTPGWRPRGKRVVGAPARARHAADFLVAEQQRGAVRASTGCPAAAAAAQHSIAVPPCSRSSDATGNAGGSDSPRKKGRAFPLVPDVPYVFRGAQPSGAALFVAKHATAAEIATHGWQFAAKVPLPVPLGAEKPTKVHERLRDIVHFRFAV